MCPSAVRGDTRLEVSNESDFWARTWEERHDAVEAALGPIRDEVASFSWRSGIRVPGACATTLPPTKGDGVVPARPDWLTLTMGLSQPLDASEVRARRAKKEPQSGFGFELGVLTDAPATWPAKLLYDPVTYVTEPNARPVGRGDRFAFGTYLVDGVERLHVGGLDLQPVDELRALVVWPYLPKPSFSTSTGTADVLVATGITQGEWDLAKSVSSPHLLLWLGRMGIGQRTIRTRACLTRNPAAMAEWAAIASLADEEVARQLAK